MKRFWPLLFAFPACAILIAAAGSGGAWPHGVWTLAVALLSVIGAVWSGGLRAALQSLTILPSLSQEQKRRREIPHVRKLLAQWREAALLCDALRHFFLFLGVASWMLYCETMLGDWGGGIYWLAGAMAVFGLALIEIAPRSHAIEMPEEWVEYGGWALWILLTLLSPVRRIAGPVPGWLADAARPGESSAQDEGASEKPGARHEESESSVLESGKFELIDSVLEFAETRVDRVFTPFAEALLLPVGMDREELNQKMRMIARSRVPVYEGVPDRIIGILHVKDVLLNPDRSAREILRPPFYVNEQSALFDVLRGFKRHKTHIAIVVEEYGMAQGVVTMHDLLEEIVGKMRDETDGQAEPIIQTHADGSLDAPGHLELEDLKEDWGIDLEHPDVRTLSGLVMSCLERMPRVGDVAEYKGCRLRVKRMGERVANRILIFPPSKAEGSGGSQEGGGGA
ncbi:HlyC/CorC family transporter [Candidatus Sumerlaeota bacterium]|nr:HlyC/CorC family transporter [Candidatus Sumerlaeota bacterium]